MHSNNGRTTLKSKLNMAVLALAAGLCWPVMAADNQLSASEHADGWQLLFNGKDLMSWRNFQKTDLSPLWQIEQGAIKLSGKGGGDILTKASYQHFELQLEWKIAEAGNSGVFILADETGKAIYSHAPEIQILDNERHSDNKLATHLSGSLYDMVASPAASHKKAGEWNQLRIRLDKQQLQVWQNGVPTTDILIHGPEWQQKVATSKFATWPGFAKKSSGHIGLQDHGDIVWFKNIKIKELNK